MKALASLLLAILMTGCSVINLGINRPFCGPERDGPPHVKCQASPPAHEWESFDGTKFPYLEALPGTSHRPKGVVILVPGWDGVTGDFKELTERLVQRGYAVYGSELRCQSYDPVWLRHGWVGDWQAWVCDLRCFTEKVRGWQPGVPVYYCAHSMGCLIALEAVAGPGKTVDGLILQSPAITMMKDEESVRMKFLRVVLSPLRPPHILAMRLLRRDLTGDRKYDCAWMASPDRVHAGYTVHYFNEACRMGHEALVTSRSLRNRKLPVLAMEGGRDGAATASQPEGRLREYILEDLGAGDPGSLVEFKYYAEGHHLMTAGETPRKEGGLVKEAAIRDILGWLEGRARRDHQRQ